MLDVSNISVTYGAHRALDKASVNVEPGEIVVILGANGAGKSSLLKAIAGTCEGQVTGQVELDGHSLSGLPAEQIVIQGIAFVPEGRGIFGDLSVQENLLLGAHATEARLRQNSNLSRVYDLFPKLREREKQIARTMSGGEQQMVAIGRAMMANPKFLMLDEPSLGLSPLLCKELFQSLSHISDSGIGVLMVEQNAKQSLAIADRAYLIENGEITSENSAQSMMHDPAVQVAYLGGAGGANKTPPTVILTPEASKEPFPGPTDESVSSKHRFIQPAVKGQGEVYNTGVGNVDINALVAKADAVAQQQTNIQQGTGGNQPTQPNSVSPSPLTNGATAIHNSTNDPHVKSLLNDFELAAKKARQGSPSNKVVASEQTEPASVPNEHDDALPVIPVFRKSTVEIYRRGPSGELQKVEER